MRKISEIRTMKKNIRNLEKKYKDFEFTSKEFNENWRWDTFCLQTMKKLGYVEVVRVEPYEVEEAKGVSYYAKFGDNKILIQYYDISTCKKLGIEVVEEIEKVMGKRYFYKVNYENLKNDYNKSVLDYIDFKKKQAKRKLAKQVDKASQKIEKYSQKLSLAEKEYDNANRDLENFSYKNNFGLQLM